MTKRREIAGKIVTTACVVAVMMLIAVIWGFHVLLAVKLAGTAMLIALIAAMFVF